MYNRYLKHRRKSFRKYKKTGSISQTSGVTDYPCRLVVGESQFWTSRQPPAHSTTYVKPTNIISSFFYAHFATDPATSLTGNQGNTSWLSGKSNQRFHIDLGSSKIITRILYDNFHNSGGDTDSGAKNFTLWGTNEADAFAETTYATDTDWTQIGGALQFEQHSASDAADPKYITVTNTTAYRYYCCKISDNWGDASYMGLRRIALQEQPYDVHCSGHCQSDFGDIRFYDGSDNALDYWIDWTTLTGTTPNQSVEVWVKTAAATDGTTVKLKYGDAALDDASDGTAVFTKFKDFESGSDGDSIADADGDWTVVSGTCEIDTAQKYSGTRSAKLVGGATSPDMTIPVTAADTNAIMLRTRKSNGAGNHGIVHGNGSKFLLVKMDTSENIIYYGDAGDVDTGANCSVDTWESLEVNNLNWSAGTYDIWFNRGLITSGAAMRTDAGFADTFRVWDSINTAGNDAWIDDLIVRKYANPEPVWGAWGEEELDA